MSRFGLNTYMLSRCGNTWLKASTFAAPMGKMMAVPLHHSVRHVSTTRPKKAQAMKDSLKDTVVAVPTAKAPKASTKTKTNKASSEATAVVEKEGKATTQAKKTGTTKAKATKTKTTSSATVDPKPRSAAKSAAAGKSSPLPAPKAPANAAVHPKPKAETPKPMVPSTAAANAQGTAAGSGRHTPPQQSPVTNPAPADVHGSEPSRPKANIHSPEYKQAVWRWTTTIIALPILLVTSYFLYDRLVLGNESSLERYREKIQGVAASGEAVTAVSGDAAVQTSNTA